MSERIEIDGLSFGLTDEERAALPPGAGGLTLALYRIAKLADRLSQLEGSTRAQLMKHETKIAQLDGDIAELAEIAHGAAKGVQAIEVGLEQSDFMRIVDIAAAERRLAIAEECLADADRAVMEAEDESCRMWREVQAARRDLAALRAERDGRRT